MWCPSITWLNDIYIYLWPTLKRWLLYNIYLKLNTLMWPTEWCCPMFSDIYLKLHTLTWPRDWCCTTKTHWTEGMANVRIPFSWQIIPKHVENVIWPNNGTANEAMLPHHQLANWLTLRRQMMWHHAISADRRIVQAICLVGPRIYSAVAIWPIRSHIINYCFLSLLPISGIKAHWMTISLMLLIKLFSIYFTWWVCFNVMV